jgi:hypothetical protein
MQSLMNECENDSNSNHDSKQSIISPPRAYLPSHRFYTMIRKDISYPRHASHSRVSPQQVMRNITKTVVRKVKGDDRRVGGSVGFKYCKEWKQGLGGGKSDLMTKVLQHNFRHRSFSRLSHSRRVIIKDTATPKGSM